MNIRYLGAIVGVAYGWQPRRAAPERPLMPLYDAATITAPLRQRAREGSRDQRRRLNRRRAPSVFADWNRLSIQFADFAYPVYLLQNVATDKATRDAAQTCLEKLLPFETEMAQSEPLYRRVRAVTPKDAIDQTFKQDLIEKFEDGGATLAARQTQARAGDCRRDRAPRACSSARTSTKIRPPSC